MRYTIRIKRQENKEAKPFWQEFEIEAEGELSIAAMLYGEKMRGMCDANQWSARTCLFYIFAISKGKSNCTGTFE